MPTLAQIIKELLRVHNRFPRKRLGQHFLIDPKVLLRIISALRPGREDLVIEIGSGLGQLTLELARAAGQAVAVEIDSELLKISQDILKDHHNIKYVGMDILKYDWGREMGDGNYKIAGNLPYYITAPIIEKILESKKKPELCVLMVQKEVAERMAAGPGTKKYGSFSIFVQFYAEVEIDSYVSKSSFYPWPKVGSAIVILKPHKTPKFKVKDEKLFFDIVHAAFQQRRKQLRNSLAKFNLEGAGIDLKRRPETLSLDEFIKLANMV